MKTYCITPVHNPNIDYLKQNIESIRSQTKEVKHMLVFDGQGLDQRKIQDCHTNVTMSHRFDDVTQIWLCRMDLVMLHRYDHAGGKGNEF